MKRLSSPLPAGERSTRIARCASGEGPSFTNPSNEFSNLARQRFLISAKARDHRLQHCGRVEAAEVDAVTGRRCNQLQKRKLGPSITFPEGMDRIQLGEKVCRHTGKPVGIEFAELPGRGKLAKQL